MVNNAFIEKVGYTEVRRFQSINFFKRKGDYTSISIIAHTLMALNI